MRRLSLRNVSEETRQEGPDILILVVRHNRKGFLRVLISEGIESPFPSVNCVWVSAVALWRHLLECKLKIQPYKLSLVTGIKKSEVGAHDGF